MTYIKAQNDTRRATLKLPNASQIHHVKCPSDFSPERQEGKHQQIEIISIEAEGCDRQEFDGPVVLVDNAFKKNK
jgi:hypothetical protein